MEDQYIEYKKGVSKDNFIKDAIALLNSSGGKIIFGIHDKTYEVIGIKDNEFDSAIEKITSSLRENIVPNPQDYIELVHIIKEDKNCIELIIRQAVNNELFYWKKYGRGPKGVFQRIGASSVPMEEAKVDLIIRNSNPVQLEELEIEHQNLISYEKLKKIYKMNNNPLSSNKMKNRGLINSKGKFTKVMELFADENNVRIAVSKYLGKVKKPSELIFTMDFGNEPLYEVFEKVKAKLIAENETYVAYGNIKRFDLDKYDQEAVKEALINAVVHNDYTRSYGPKVFIYSDRIEINSTGGISNNLKLKNIFEGDSEPRNPKVVDIFRDLGITDSIGQGIPFIIDKYGKEAFKVDESFFKVILKAKAKDDIILNGTDSLLVEIKDIANEEKYSANKEKYSANKEKYSANEEKYSANEEKYSANKEKYSANKEKYSANEEKIINYIKSNKEVTSKEVAEYLSISERRARVILMNLIEKNRLKRKKIRYAYHYSIKENSIKEKGE